MKICVLGILVPLLLQKDMGVLKFVLEPYLKRLYSLLKSDFLFLFAKFQGFISIDCGSDEDYMDTGTNISYMSDKELIDTGIVGAISPDLSENLPQFAKNLRSFPLGTRNCYTLRPEQGKNNNYLIRATFIYGNYDGENRQPVFDLHLGVNAWKTVNLTNTDAFRYYYYYYDIIHVPLRDYIDVCLIDTGHGVPFISSLELRLLDNSIYQTQGRALVKIWGYDVGRNNSENSFR